MSTASSLLDLSDNELHSLLRNDNEEAFSLLYQRYWKRMLYKARLKLDSPEDAEEIVQDTFVDLWKSRHSATLKNSFHTYISAIVNYKIIARMAANSKQLPYGQKDVQEVQIEDDSTRNWLAFADLREEFETALNELPEKCRIVFKLSRDAGLTDRQISEELGISKKTVEAHISRALKQLKTSLGQFFSSLLSLLLLLSCTLF